MRKSCLLFTCLNRARTLTHCFQQEETVLPRVVLEFLLFKYLQVSQMMIFEVIKLCLDHIHHLLLLQLAISSKSKCFNSCMHHYLLLYDYKNNSNLMNGWWLLWLLYELSSNFRCLHIEGIQYPLNYNGVEYFLYFWLFSFRFSKYLH